MLRELRSRSRDILWVGGCVLFVVASPFLCCFASLQLDKWQHPPSPGYADWLDSSDWDVKSISDFLGVRLPSNADVIHIEGGRGREGSYGVMPRLQFSFKSPSASAASFIGAFCNGVMYQGYNPLKSEDSYLPSPNAILIRGQGTIHYSQSPGVPETIFGNRCERKSWIEEFVIDKSDSRQFVVSYRLSYVANVNPEEYYPRAQTVAPFGNKFRFYITGLREEKSQGSQSVYVLSYPTMCFETSDLALMWDYWQLTSEANLDQYQGASVKITIDGTVQQPAKITNWGHLIDASHNAPLAKWDYCLTGTWQLVVHSVEMVVAPVKRSPKMFNWQFEVRPTQTF